MTPPTMYGPVAAHNALVGNQFQGSAVFNFGDSKERLETPPTPSIAIPFCRDADFVERGTILDRINQRCGRPGSRTALVGLGGVGKSQLAIEHAYRIRERSPATWVFWIHASNATRFEQSVRDMADCAKILGRHNPQANIFQLVHNWLRDERKGPWVLILDNVDEAGFLMDGAGGAAAISANSGGQTSSREHAKSRPLLSYLPQCDHGSILITSRSRSEASRLVEEADIIAVGPMGREDATRLFQKKLVQEKLRQHAAGDAGDTAELVAALEHMPLAIVQAAAYISQRWPRSSARQYLDEFRRSDRKKAGLLGYEGGRLRRDAEAKNSILITWQISFEHIRDARPSAADILSLMSFCDRQGIPESLLRNRSRQGETEPRQNAHALNLNERENDYDNGESDSNFTEDESDQGEMDGFEDDILTLKKYSFIVVNEDKMTFEMHRLIQLATLEWLEANGQQEYWRHQLVQRLSAELPNGEYENWPLCQRLFPHAQSVATRAPKALESLRKWGTVLYKAAWYALRVGKWEEAETLSSRALKARKKVLEANDNDVINALAMVASVYKAKGRWEAAEELEVQVMEMSKTKLGADHPDTLTSMANLAFTWRAQDRDLEACNLLRKCVNLQRQKLGSNHPDFLSSLEALTQWEKDQLEDHHDQSRHVEAEGTEEPLQQRHEPLKEKLPNTLKSMASMAVTYRAQRNVNQFEGIVESTAAFSLD